MKKLFLLVVGLLLLGTLDARAQFAQGNLTWGNGTSNITNDFTVPFFNGNWPTAPTPGNFTQTLTVTGINPNPTLSWSGVHGNPPMTPGTPAILVTAANGAAITNGSQVPVGVYTVYFYNAGSGTVRQIVDPGAYTWDTFQHSFNITQGPGSQQINATVGWRTTREPNPQQQQGQQIQPQGGPQQTNQPPVVPPQGQGTYTRWTFAIIQRWNQTVNKQVLNSRLGQRHPNQRPANRGYYPRLLLRAGYPLNATLSTTTTPAGKTTVKVTFPGRKTTKGQSSISNGRVYQTRSVLSGGSGRARR